MKKIYLSSVLCLALSVGAFAQGNSKQHSHDDGFNSRQHYQMVAEQHRLVKTYLNFDAFEKMYKEVLKKVNVAEKDKLPFGKMLKEKFSLADRYTIISKINMGELTESNIQQYLADIKPTEYASYYQGAYLKGKSSLLNNAPQIHAAGTTEVENWLSSRLHAPVVASAACGNIDFNNGSFSGWTGNYTTSNCTSPTPNTRTNVGFNNTGMNVTTDQHGLCNGGNDPSVTLATLPCVSPYSGGAPVTCRLGDVLDGCGAADLTYSFTVNNNNTNFTYSYAVVLYDGHPASDAPKVTITMKNLTTGANIPCAAYQIDATQGAGGANGYQQAQSGNTLLYFKPWSQVYIPLLTYVGQNVQVTVVASDCNGGAHRGYCYIDFDCSPLQLLSTTPMICGASTAILTAPPGAASYQWSTVGGSGCITSGTTSQTVSVNCAGHYQVTLGSFGSGCTLVIDTIIPGAPAGPTANFTDVPGCFTQAVPFTDQSNPNGAGAITSWTYTFGDGGTSNSQNPSHTYAAAGTYTVTMSCTNGGCVDTYTSTVTVTAGVIPSFTSPPVCIGSPTNLTNTTVGAATYTWTYNGTTSNAASTSTTYTAAGTFPVTLDVSTGGGCTGTITQNVIVNPPPTITATTNTLCAGGAAVPVTANGATTYTWNNGPTTATMSDNPAATTAYTVTGTDANGCVSSGTTTITVITNPNPSVAPITICQGLTGTLTATGCTTYTWTGPNLGSTTGTTVTCTPPTTSTYTIVGSVGTCTGTTTVLVTISPPPTVALTSPPVTCPGQLVPAPTYTSNPVDPNMVYAWTNNNTATGMSAANGVGIPGSFTAASNNTLANITGTITVIPSLGGCVGPPATYTVTIYPTPVISPIANVEFCPNVVSAPINFTIQPAGGTPSFAWFNSNTSIGLASSGTVTPIPSFTGVNTGSTAQVANLSVSGSLNGCPAIPVPFTITVDPNPIAAFSANHLICVGSPMAFTDLSTVGTGFIAQWAWNLDGTASAFSTAQNPQLVIQPAGTHSVTLLATSDKGCTNVTTHTVYINYLPVASYTGGGQGCPILTVNNFTDASSVTGPAQVVNWNWNFGNGATASTQVIPGVLTYGNPSPVQNAVYTVSLIVSSDSGCVSTAYANPCVTVYPHPLPGFTWGPQDPAPDIESPTVYFFDQSQGASGQNGLQWYLGDVFLNNPANNYTTVQNPIHGYEHYDPYIYYVTQWVQNSYGCKDSITKPIEILPNWTFYIPNAFSPNGDGVNEGFKGTGIGIDNTTYNLWIFDRWGNMIFYSADLEKSWDGRIQGKNGDIVQEDVYVWKVKFHDFMGKKHEYKGTVSVIK